MMTSFAFIAGLVPLVIAEGAGMLSRARRRHGGVRRDAGGARRIFLIPVLYVIFQWTREKVKREGGVGCAVRR